MFHLTKSWLSAVEVWRRFLYADDDARPHRLVILLWQAPTKTNETQGTQFCVDPLPSDFILEAIRTHPGIASLRDAASLLATATAAVRPLLERHGLDAQYADVLLATLHGCPGLPSLADHRASWFVQRHLEAVDNRIWNGALTGDEDQRERSAFWDDVLAGLKPTTDRAAVAKLIDDLLAKPRDPAREVQALDAIRAREARDETRAALMEILRRDQSPPDAPFVRWRELAEWGLRQFERTSSQGKQTICFRLSIAAHRGSSRPEDPLPTDLLWATQLLAATEQLYEPARTAGFEATDLRPIHVLLRSLRDILAGCEVDISGPVGAVGIIHDEIVMRQRSGSGRRGSLDGRDGWQPSAHQRKVLGILDRDGKLQTAVLWSRISPKHTNLRAHQGAMRDLVENKKVKRTGRGRATHFELR